MKDKVPIVSVCCITYNHVNFIGKTIESFLMQKTNFPFEIIIHDDASDDGTIEIIKEYANKYPDIVKLILQKENQYSKGIKILSTFVWPRTKGKYIALCEGDDYWTDPYKLQKQVDILEKNKDCSLIFHAAEHFYIDKKKTIIHKYSINEKYRKFTAKDAIMGGGEFITTNSILFPSNFIKELPEWYSFAPTGDYALTLLLSSYGKIAYIDDIMSVYRKGTESSWTKQTRNIRYQFNWLRRTNKMLKAFNKWSNYKYSKTIKQKQNKNSWNFFKYLIRQIIKLNRT